MRPREKKKRREKRDFVEEKMNRGKGKGNELGGPRDFLLVFSVLSAIFLVDNFGFNRAPDVKF